VIAARRLLIQGLVQGVGFRYAMREEARRLSLRGWVRNRGDGSVEAVACGDKGALDALERWARRGPRAARVDSVAVSTLSTEDLEQLQPAVGPDFRQVETAWD
jgi:acylphosphatase